MLTADDIKKLTDYQLVVFKDAFATKDGIKNLDTKIDALLTSVDAITKHDKDRDEGATVLDKRIKNTEDWIDQAAPKVGVKFQH